MAVAGAGVHRTGNGGSVAVGVGGRHRCLAPTVAVARLPAVAVPVADVTGGSLHRTGSRLAVSVAVAVPVAMTALHRCLPSAVPMARLPAVAVPVTHVAVVVDVLSAVRPHASEHNAVVGGGSTGVPHAASTGCRCSGVQGG
jgi:hypothetical protein